MQQPCASTSRAAVQLAEQTKAGCTDRVELRAVVASESAWRCLAVGVVPADQMHGTASSTSHSRINHAKRTYSAQRLACFAKGPTSIFLVTRFSAKLAKPAIVSGLPPSSSTHGCSDRAALAPAVIGAANSHRGSELMQKPPQSRPGCAPSASGYLTCGSHLRPSSLL